MFFNAPGNPSKLKQAVYLMTATILGVLLSFLVHAFVEIKYLNWLESQNLTVTFYYGCALPPIFSGGLLLAGAVGGLMLGRLWWRLVYVDRVWAKKYTR